MCDEQIEVLISNLEIANKTLCHLVELSGLSNEDHTAVQEAYDLIKQSIRILSDEEIMLEIKRYSDEE